VERLIKLLRRLPIKWQHKLRYWAEMANAYSEDLVITERITWLIENTDDPDYAEYDRRLALMRERWGVYDNALNRLAVNRRFSEFKRGLPPVGDNNG